ncbi:putative ribonuclease H protein [Vitis vinifera]|uniref:Putative ribonuclease H protein n=1 Tax=Vitis vinifera TaxID=29760 RepID=A0A438HTU0_VITVI|nr:putative ribonuclease H protein [Vitis vinifera]
MAEQPKTKENSATGGFNSEEMEKLRSLLGSLDKPTRTCSLALSDSSATDHITSKSQLFHTYTPSSSNKKIAVANDSLATVTGFGNIYITATLILKNVLHVPKLSANLVSIQKLTLDTALRQVKTIDLTKSVLPSMLSSLGEPKVGKDSKRLPLGGGASQSKLHLVNWSIVCMEKKDGGLGIKNLSRLNKALLGKWCWRFASEQDSLWKQVIVRKFGEEEGCWCSGASRESHGVGLWKAIRNGWMEFSKRVAFKVGDGSKVRFWKDRWCGEDSLEEPFPSLYSLASSRDAWVAQLWDQSGI